jgi:hypothetical protein
LPPPLCVLLRHVARGLLPERLKDKEGWGGGGWKVGMELRILMM